MAVWRHPLSHSLSPSTSTIISVVEQQFSFLNVQIFINYQNVNLRNQEQIQITKIIIIFLSHPEQETQTVKCLRFFLLFFVSPSALNMNSIKHYLRPECLHFVTPPPRRHPAEGKPSSSSSVYTCTFKHPVKHIAQTY